MSSPKKVIVARPAIPAVGGADAQAILDSVAVLAAAVQSVRDDFEPTDLTDPATKAEICGLVLAHFQAVGDNLNIADGCDPLTGNPTFTVCPLMAPFSTNSPAGALHDVTVTTSDDSPYDVDWGDGTVTTGHASGTIAFHTYTSPFAGDVNIIYPSSSEITEFSSATQGRWDFDISTLPSSLTDLSVRGENTLTGDVSTLPPGLTNLSVRGENTLTGDVSTLPSGLTSLDVRGENTLTGNASALPPGLTSLDLRGDNTLSGDVSSLPPGLTSLSVQGDNTLSGSASALPSGLTSLDLRGDNTLSGNISGLPSGLTSLSVQGNNTLTGNISTLPPGLTFLIVRGNNTLAFTSNIWPFGNTFRSINISNLSTAGTNNILEAAQAVTSWTNEQVIDLSISAPPTARGVTAANAIVAAHPAVTIITA